MGVTVMIKLKMNIKCILFAMALSLHCGVLWAESLSKVPIHAVNSVDVKQYVGTWYEIARKPMFFQRSCLKDVQARYAITQQGTLSVENSCIKQNNEKSIAHGEAFIMNAPYNSQLKVSFLPSMIRWLPVGRGDYWVLKRDDQYQTALVGDPDRQYLWLLARTPHISAETLQSYVQYAKDIGYDISDFNLTLQTEH